MKQTEGKRGTRTQDILIDLMWKLRSKGFGDQGSHTKRGELSDKESNKLHNICKLILNDSTVTRKFVSKYTAFKLFSHQVRMFLCPTRSERCLVHLYANLLGYKIQTVTNYRYLL